MFGFRKKGILRRKLVAVVDGTRIPIEEVPDPVFSQRMMGDGFAIRSSGDTIYACADAVVTMLFPSNHAIGLKLSGGTEVLLHVGVDTVNENGKGFTSLCEKGKKVKQGEALLKIDREYLLSKGYDLSVIVVFTNKESYKELQMEAVTEVKGAESVVATYTV